MVIGYISPGQTATAFTDSLADLMRQEHRVIGRISLVSGPGISTARCDVVASFLNMPAKPEWLLMVDADMSFQDNIVDRFLEIAHEKERPVIGGLCFGGGRVGHPFPTMYQLTDPTTNGGKVTKYIADYPQDGLCKVDATGAACLFVHRDVFVRMHDEYGRMPDGHRNPHPWFSETVHLGYEYGEDFTFCMRLQQMKIPIYVHTGIKLGHVKTQVYDEEYYNNFRRNHAQQD